jgi:hypothetical protein
MAENQPAQSALTATVDKMASPSTISTKVLAPLIAGVVAGTVLIVLSFVIDSADMRQYGIGVLVAALGYGGVGYTAPVGTVSLVSQKIEQRPPS